MGRLSADAQSTRAGLDGGGIVRAVGYPPGWPEGASPFASTTHPPLRRSRIPASMPTGEDGKRYLAQARLNVNNRSQALNSPSDAVRHGREPFSVNRARINRMGQGIIFPDPKKVPAGRVELPNLSAFTAAVALPLSYAGLGSTVIMFRASPHNGQLNVMCSRSIVIRPQH